MIGIPFATYVRLKKSEMFSDMREPVKVSLYPKARRSDNKEVSIR